MSFAVIQTGGKQYKVKAGEILKVEKLIDKDKVEFKNILAYGDEKNAEVGSPKIEGAKVFAEQLPLIFEKLYKSGLPIKIYQQCQKNQNNQLIEQGQHLHFLALTPPQYLPHCYTLDDFSNKRNIEDFF